MQDIQTSKSPPVGSASRNSQARSLVFREAVQPSDVDGVRNIVESTKFFSKDEVEVAVELVVARLTHGPSSGYYFLFGESDQEVVGYTCFGPIACTQASFDLYWIAVSERLRGQGVGKELIEQSEQSIKRMVGQRVYIETSSRPLYEPTRAFYLRCGYHEEARLRNFYAPDDDKVIYVRALQATSV
ncbi:MAG: GNAT family N-acetyltransferase [Planctomycetota bacterium]